jgi:hypothetical protein
MIPSQFLLPSEIKNQNSLDLYATSSLGLVQPIYNCVPMNDLTALDKNTQKILIPVVPFTGPIILYDYSQNQHYQYKKFDKNERIKEKKSAKTKEEPAVETECTLKSKSLFKRIAKCFVKKPNKSTKVNDFNYDYDKSTKFKDNPDSDRESIKSESKLI